MWEKRWYRCQRCKSNILSATDVWDCALCGSWDVWPFPEHVVPPGQVELFEFGDVDGDMLTPDVRDAREAVAGLRALLPLFDVRRVDARQTA